MSTVRPPAAGVYDPTACPAPAVISVGECEFSSSWTIAASSSPPYYLQFGLEPGDPNVVRNHIPLDLAAAAGAFTLHKTAASNIASTGDLVAYKLVIRNSSVLAATNLTIVDQPPRGFTYVPGSAVANDGGTARAVEPISNANQLTWSISPLNAAPTDSVLAGETLTVSYKLQVSGSVDVGEYNNTAVVLNGLNTAVSNESMASVRIIADPVFDCPDVIGKVFDDRNENGYQDEGEKGIAAARLMTVNGQLITSDAFGRFHVGCALLPDKDRGSNFILKLDPRSLPLGYRITTENPRVVRLTRGKLTKLNFGVSIGEIALVEFDDRSFANGQGGIDVRFVDELNKALQSGTSIWTNVRLVYYTKEKNHRLINQRLDQVSRLFLDKAAKLGRLRKFHNDQIEVEIVHLGDKQIWKESFETNTEQHFPDDVLGNNLTSSGALIRFASDGVATTGEKKTVLAARRSSDVALVRSNLRITSTSLETKKRLNVTSRIVKGSLGRELQFYSYTNYSHWIERSEIRLFDRNASVHSQPKLLLAVDANNGAKTLMKGDHWKGYRYVLRVYDRHGRFDETRAKELNVPSPGTEPSAEQSIDLSGYGRNSLSISSIPIAGGTVAASGRSVPKGTKVLVHGQPVPVSQDGSFIVEQILPAGSHNIELELVKEDNTQSSKFTRRIRIKEQDFVAVALADLTVGQKLNRDPSEDDIYTEGRLAFYFKGKVRGDILITAMADSGEGDVEQLLNDIDKRDARSLINRLDPDRYYNVYGDGSEINEDAPTSGKFYVRVEKDKSYGLWGNYETGFNESEYGRLNRSLYGGKAVYRSNGVTSYGESHTEFHAFVADPGTLAAQDKFRGTGGSVYFLRRKDVTIGSEKLRIEILDKTTSLIKESRLLVYGVDYEIDYLQGRVILTQALPSTIEEGSLFSTGSLSGDRLYLVADYEFVSAVSESDDLIYGARASQWIGNTVRLGGTYYKTEKDLSDVNACGSK